MSTVTLCDLADDAYEAVRAINHLTIGSALAAPTVYDVTGSLKAMGFGLDQAVGQMAAALVRSLDELDIAEDDGADPRPRALEAAHLLVEAGEHGRQIGELLELAQQQLSRQHVVARPGDD